MAIINTAGNIPFSKNRNGKSKSLDVRDMSGKPIRGSVEGHYQQVNNKIQDRYDTKKEAFQLLNFEQIKDIYRNPVKPTICSNTDKAALADVYFDKQYHIYDELSIEQLEEINDESLNTVEKIAKERCLKLKKLQNKIDNETTSENEASLDVESHI